MTITSDGANLVTTITIQRNTEFSSDLLDEIALIGATAYSAKAEKESIHAPGKKGEIVTGLVIHLAGSVIYDLLKLAAERLVNHSFYDPLILLNIDGRSVTLQDAIDRQ